jgi:hypothetical protein
LEPKLAVLHHHLVETADERLVVGCEPFDVTENVGCLGLRIQRALDRYTCALGA